MVIRYAEVRGAGFLSILVAGCLLVALTDAAVAAGFASHPPQRPLPEPSDRPMTEGPAYFIDVQHGDDANDGSEAHPWQSLRHALGRLEPGDTLYLREGTYYERPIIRLQGQKGQPITIRSYPGELAVIDGGYCEFFKEPEAAWEPVPGGQQDEYRSTRTYPELAEDAYAGNDGGSSNHIPLGPPPAEGKQDTLGVARTSLYGGLFSRWVKVLGNFGDSMVPLHGYWNPGDLPDDVAELARDNDFYPVEQLERAVASFVETFDYHGPGLWYDMQTQRIHVRLSHTRYDHLEPLGDANYRGETDPRRLPLAIAGPRVAVHVEGTEHLRLQDLIVRGSRGRTLNIEASSDIELDGLTLYAGAPALHIESSSRIMLTNSALRGLTAPWIPRLAEKRNGIAGYLLVADPRQGPVTDVEMAYNEFTDNHDGMVIGHIDNLDFHRNYVHNFNDDGLYLTRWPHFDDAGEYVTLEPQSGENVRIYQNYVSRTFGALAFGGSGEGQEDRIAYVYRNVFDLREPFNTRWGQAARAQTVLDHGTPIWKPMKIYHNTFLIADTVFRSQYGAKITRSHGGLATGQTKRSVLNNIFCHMQGMPGMTFFYRGNQPFPEGMDLIVDGNLHWSVEEGPDYEGDFLADGRALRPRLPDWFEKSKEIYAPGWTANDMFADPKFIHLTRDWREHDDLRLRQSSPAANAGVEIPEDWPDPLRELDQDAPDIGALPVGAEPWRVGVRGRFTIFGEPRSLRKHAPRDGSP